MVEKLSGLTNIDVLEVGKLYDYGAFRVSPVKLYHDVPNFGWRIFLSPALCYGKEEEKIFHATDTAHLEGIGAKGYDLYAIEHNYDEDKIIEAIKEARQKGEYCYGEGSMQTHLSWQQARAFIEANRKPSSEIIELHKSSHFY